jgi:integrase
MDSIEASAAAQGAEDGQPYPDCAECASETAVEWDVIERMPCTIKLLPVSKVSTQFYDFDDFERLVTAAKATDPRAHLLVLLSGEAGLRLGEMVALEWTDFDFVKRQLCVQRSAWKGRIGSPKGGRLRYIPLTTRLAATLRITVTFEDRWSCTKTTDRH